jgi:hypothetical protein
VKPQRKDEDRARSMRVSKVMPRRSGVVLWRVGPYVRPVGRGRVEDGSASEDGAGSAIVKGGGWDLGFCERSMRSSEVPCYCCC